MPAAPYFDANGNPVAVNDYSVLEVYNNAFGTKVGEAYFDSGLNPVNKKRQPYCRMTTEKREDGVTVNTYYNANGDIVKTEEK